MKQLSIGNQNTFEILINFFTKDNWTFEQIKPKCILKMAFQGKSDR
jgi:putative flippase GtrA